MAKRKSYKSPARSRSYAPAANNTGLKALAVFQALVSIALAIVIVCAVGSEGFTNKDIKTWFKKTTEQQLPDESEAPEEEEPSLIITPDEVTFNLMSLEATPVALTDEEAEENSAVAVNGKYTLTANVFPLTSALAAEVDWEAVSYYETLADEFDPSEYLTITPSEDNSLTAEVKCIKAFPYRIRIVCTLRDDPSITASCAADYQRRYLGTAFSMTLLDIGNATDDHKYVENAWETTDAGENVTFRLSEYATAPLFANGITPKLSVGTKGYTTSQYMTYKVYVSCTMDFLMYRSQGYTGTKVNIDANNYLLCEGSYQYIGAGSGNQTCTIRCAGYQYGFFGLMCSDINVTTAGYDEDGYYYFMQMLWSYYGYCSAKSITCKPFTMTVEATLSDGKKYTTTSSILISMSQPKAPSVSDMGFSEGSVIF